MTIFRWTTAAPLVGAAVVTGRATRMHAELHLVLLASFVFLALTLRVTHTS